MINAGKGGLVQERSSARLTGRDSLLPTRPWEPRHRTFFTIYVIFLLTRIGARDTLTREMVKEMHQLQRAARLMIQGALSEVTRQCGDPGCACSQDPARRHGPHLYLTYRSQGRSHSVYVPAAPAPALRQAHAAWRRFLEVGTTLAARNRQQWLRRLEVVKKKARTARRSQREAHS